MKSIIIESIEKFIYEGKIDSAIDYMIIAIKELVGNNEGILKDITLLRSRFSIIEDQNIKGIIKFDDYNLESSKIVLSVIEYKKQLEDRIIENTEDGEKRDSELELLIYTNAYANTIKDVQMLKKTLHSAIKGEDLENPFELENVNLLFEIESIEIVEIGAEFATANVVQITKDKTPSFFRNNRVKASHTFLKEDGRWKFYNSIIQEVKYL